MPKTKDFFLDNVLDNLSSPTSNFYISRIPRLPRHIYKNLCKTSQVTKSKNRYGFTIKQINYELLTIFYTVVTLGSISKAAKQLSVSQPAVSLSLNKIEKQIGFLLFKQVKTKRTIILSPFGSIVFNHIQRLFQIIDDSLDFSSLNSNLGNANNPSFANFKKATLYPTFNKNPLYHLSTRSFINKSFQKKYFPQLSKMKFEWFETSSKYFILQKKSLVSEKFQNLKDTSFIIDKFSSLSNFNNQIAISLNNNNIVEIQSTNALIISYDMKISNIIYWGSEI